MDPWYPRIAVIAASIALVAIRAPHGQRSRAMRTKTSARGAFENLLLGFAMLAFFLPLVWVVSAQPASANYALEPIAFWSGSVVLVASLWLFARSHVDLGTNWSITLEVREELRLVTSGVYRTLRHPMYTALLLNSLGFALVLPNWIAGPAYLVSMVLLVAARLRPEEQLKRAEFGAANDEYIRRSWRLIPGVW
jgi:protein-S-isoprenylcysteine O-methyltransferase Ste14